MIWSRITPLWAHYDDVIQDSRLTPHRNGFDRSSEKFEREKRGTDVSDFEFNFFLASSFSPTFD